MRILGIGDTCDLGSMYHRLAQSGHEVRVHIAHEPARDVFGGMLQINADWSAELPWVREAGRDGLILFETATMGEVQDQLRRDGFQVIGGSAYGDRLEGDREFGQQELRHVGLQTAANHHFTAYGQAIEFVRGTGGRYVFKANGAGSERTRNYIGEMECGSDMIALLQLNLAHAAQAGQAGTADFVLMEHVQGVEVGVGAYFNGVEFMRPVCLDFEHKRLFPGELGELTGEMGTIVSYRGALRIFEATLGRMADRLREGGYVGYINLNLMANARGLWPLEFTSRFGYPGYAICEALHREPWDAILRKMLERRSLDFATAEGFSAGVVLTVPPFPHPYGYEALSKGLPITLRPMEEDERARLHFCEVAQVQGQLVTSGTCGYVGVACGTGATVAQAGEQAYRLARKVVVPNLRYRSDIGARVSGHDLDALREWGWLG